MSDSERTRRRVLASLGALSVGAVGTVIADRTQSDSAAGPSRASAIDDGTRPQGGPSVEWARRYYTEATNPTPRENAQVSVKSVVRTPDGGFSVAGNQNYGQGTDDFVLLETDPAGHRRWLATYDAHDHWDRLESHIRTADGGYLLVGNVLRDRENPPTSGSSHEQRENVSRPWVVRTDADGTVRWTAEPGENEPGDLFDATQLEDGTLVVVGEVGATDDGAAWLLGFDDSGTVVLDRRYGTGDGDPETTPGGTEPDYDDRFEAVAERDDGGLLLAGASDRVGRVLGTDTDGDPRWRTSLGAQYLTVSDLVETAEGNVVVTGTVAPGRGDESETPRQEGTDAFLALLDPTGAEQWTRTYDDGDDESGLALAPTDDDGYVISGASNPGSGNSELFVAKTDGDGTERWSATYPDSGFFSDSGRDLLQTADGGYVIAARDQLVKLAGGFTPSPTATPEGTATSTPTESETATTTEPTETATATDTGQHSDDDGCEVDLTETTSGG